jgi:hypothetical protein
MQQRDYLETDHRLRQAALFVARKRRNSDTCMMNERTKATTFRFFEIEALRREMPFIFLAGALEPVDWLVAPLIAVT